MADVLGALALPVPAPAGGATVADSLLDTLASFFKAILNGRLATAWAAVAPAQTPVAFTFTRNPEDQGSFVDSKLPALYLWRSQIGVMQRPGYGLYIRGSTITAAWIFAPAKNANQDPRNGVINALSSILHEVIELKARDPSWVVPGDTDADAATKGSLLWTYVHLWRIDVGRTKRRPLVLRTPRPVTYQRVEFDVEVLEQLTEDISAYDLLDAVEVTANDAAGAPPIVTADAIFPYPPVDT